MKNVLNRYRGSYLSYALTFYFYFFCMGAFGSILSVYLKGIGKTDTEMSLIVSAAGLFSFGMIPLVGYLCDRTGRRRLISCVSILLVGVLGMVFSYSRSVWALFLLDGLVMSLINSIMPVCERMAGASKYRYGSIRVWGTLGYASAAQAAGFVMETVSPAFIFVLLLLSALLTMVGFLGAGEQSAPVPSPHEGAPEKGKGLSFLKLPSYLLFLVVALLFAGSSGVNMIYVPVLLTDLGISTGGVGTVLFFSTLIEIPLIVFSNRFMDRFSGKTLMLTSFGIIIVQFLCYGLIPSAAVIVSVVVLLKAIASTLYVMITLKIVRNLVDSSFTTTALSVVNAVTSLGTIVIQNLSGIVADSTGLPTLYLCLAGVTGLGFALTLFLRIKNTEKVFSGN